MGYAVSQDLSPDLPAYLCYYLVLLAGSAVSLVKVQALLASSPRRWNHLRTWVIFLAYASVPVALFWLSDYTNALRDTSLFSAFIIGFGYRQVLSGEYKIITPSKEVSKLWSPFEAWASSLRDAILMTNRRRTDALEARVRERISGNGITQDEEKDRVAALDRLIKLAFIKAPDPLYFQAKLGRAQKELLAFADLTPQPQPEGGKSETQQSGANVIEGATLQSRLRRQQVEFCLATLRFAVLDGLEDLFEAHGLISATEKDKILEKLRGRVIAAVGVTLLAMIVVGLPVAFFHTPAIDVFYSGAFINQT